MEHRDEPPSRGPGSAALRLLGLVLALSFLLPVPADAQYFGRNKVQYDVFDFEVLHTGHFDLHFYEDESSEAIVDVGRMAERWYERLARTFQHAFRSRKPLIFYANQPDFQQTNTISAPISQGTGGVTEGIKNRVIMPFAESYGETDHVLGHELVHAFQYDLAQARTGGGLTAINQLPLWVVEGLAEYLSVGRISSHTAMWMRDAVLRDDLPTIRQLARNPSYFPYRFGHALWAYLGGTYGDDAVVELYRAAGQGRGAGFAAASQQVLGIPADTIGKRWAEATRSYYGPLMEDRTPPNAAGDRILPRGEAESPMAVAPSVSPDGSRVAYLARRDIFTMDLYMADARTGEVMGRLASASSDMHMDALAFINSVGSWSPDGRRFAFSVFAKGDNQIAIADAERRETVRRLPVEGVGAIYSLAWSPDGETIAFSGNRGGITDLYLLDVASGNVRRLTRDAFSELHPAWSPDGSTLAFTTDRGDGSNLENLTFPRPGLGLMDVETGEVVEVRRPLGDVKHIDPAYSPDGRSLYFVADREGFSDVYRMELESGQVRQVTRLATGVSGITGLSPSLTVARESGRVLFNVFDNGGYAIHALSSQELEGTVVTESEEGEVGGVLPPREIVEPARVAAYLRDPTTGLHSGESWSRSDYSPGLQLDYISQPSVGIGVDRFGTSLGGGVAAFFSDMLGNRELGVATNINGRIEDIGAQAAFTNRKHRWNWGLQAGRSPFTTIGTRSGTTTRNGETVRFVDLIESTTVLNSVGARTEYPFSSTVRFEANASFTHWGFDVDARRTFFTAAGRPVDQTEVSLPSRDGFNIYSGAVALVQDDSYFGFTSPVRGSRARVEVEGNTGELDFVSVLGDLRKYFFWNPVTLALRGYHLGRYGSGGEDARLTPLYLGFETFVRGYDFRSFRAQECTPDPRNPERCPEFDRLLGSRVAVGKAELRVPLIGSERFGLLSWGIVPTELSLFTDAGVAWTSDESPELSFETRTAERVPVFSSGAALRFNVVGRLILQVYGAHPFQRPDEDWVWGFTLYPGF